MALFTRKTNGNTEAQLTPAPASEALLKELNPLRDVVAGLRQRLEEEKKRCVDLQKEYETACLELAQGKDADPLKVQEDMRRCVSVIAGIEQLLSKSQAKLAPLQTEYGRLYEAERRQRQQEEDRVYIEDATRRAFAAFKTWTEAEREYNRLIRDLRDKKFYNEAQQIEQACLMKAAKANMNGNNRL